MWKWIVLSALCLSCAHIESNNQRFFYSSAKKTIKHNLPPNIIKECGYRLDLEKPVVHPVTYGFGQEISGAYYPITKRVHYEKGNYSALLHEFQHFFNHNTKGGRASWECLDQVTAYYAQRIASLERIISQSR